MDIDANDVIQAVVAQRNAAQDECARLYGLVQKLTRENAELTKQIPKVENETPA